MPVNEELQEHAEHAHDAFSRKAGAGMAIIAAALAVVAVYGHLTTTEELLTQQKAADQWAFYQAKSLRRYQSEVARDILATVPGEAAAKTAEKYGANFERYEKEGEEVMDKAKEFEKESVLAGRKALRLHLGEIFLELAIVFSSLAILSRRSLFWVHGNRQRGLWHCREHYHVFRGSRVKPRVELSATGFQLGEAVASTLCVREQVLYGTDERFGQEWLLKEGVSGASPFRGFKRIGPA